MLVAAFNEHQPLSPATPAACLSCRQDFPTKGDARAAQLPALISAADRVIAAIDTTGEILEEMRRSMLVCAEGKSWAAVMAARLLGKHASACLK
jgi:hypothetical protein